MNNKYKILVVEDEINIRNLLVALLETNGYAAIVAGCMSLIDRIWLF